MKIENNISGFAFSRNPVWITDTNDDNGFSIGARVRFVASKMGATVAEIAMTRPFRINVSEILDSYSDHIPDVYSDPSGLAILEDGQTMNDRKIEFWIENDQEDMSDTVGCIVFPGGIPTVNYRKLRSLETDIFKSRLLRPKGNFFLITRSGHWKIPIKETELYPLTFIRESAGSLSVIEKHNGNAIHFDEVSEGIWALDIKVLRRRFALEANILPSVMDIMWNGEFASRLIITKSDTVKDHCLVCFRNSFGVKEIIDLTGSISRSISAQDDDQSEYLRYDMVTDSFTKCRERSKIPIHYEIAAGPIDKQNLNFFADMLNSEEVWLLGIASEPIRVIPSCEDFGYDIRPDVPLTFTISFQAAEDTDFFMGDIKGVDDSVKPRLFTSQFVKQFN